MVLMIAARSSFIALYVLSAVAFGALVVLGWRSLDAFERTVERVLRQASVYTAEQLARRLEAPTFAI